MGKDWKAVSSQDSQNCSLMSHAQHKRFSPFCYLLCLLAAYFTLSSFRSLFYLSMRCKKVARLTSRKSKDTHPQSMWINIKQCSPIHMSRSYTAGIRAKHNNNTPPPCRECDFSLSPALIFLALISALHYGETRKPSQ